MVADILSPAEAVLSSSCLADSVDIISRLTNVNLSNTHMCFFDVTSLFTIVCLLETIQS